MNFKLTITWLLLVFTGGTMAAIPPPPNVIVIVADQLRYQSTGYGGDPRAFTPHLDRLATEGMNFHQCVANAPVCAAWRASFLTGKYATSTGMAVNELRLNPNQDSLAHMFARDGYACDLIGKWHLWATNSNHEEIQSAYTPPGPYRMGFDGFWAGYNFNHENYKAWYFRDTPEPHRIQGFGDAEFVELACAQMREHAKQQKPFFIQLALSAPHDPWTRHNIPPAWYERFKQVEFPLPATWSDQPDPYMDRNADPGQWITYWKSHMTEFQRGYYALSAAVDEQVGRLLAAIDDASVRDNTIVVFTSDHGEMLGAHGRVFKTTFYEESVRTPLLIRWPGHIPAARSDACISTVDLMPTLLGLAGREIPKAVEGMNLSQVVLGKDGPEPAAALLQGMGHTYLWEDGFEWRALRDKRFTYARYLRDGRELLFDNLADPLQQRDLAQAAAHHDDLKRLRHQMNQLMNDIGDTFEKSSWYRDSFTENRVIIKGAHGPFHREFGDDVPVVPAPTQP